MNWSDQDVEIVETVEIDGNFLEENRDNGDRRQVLKVQQYNSYERREGKRRRRSISVDLEV